MVFLRLKHIIIYCIQLSLQSSRQFIFTVDDHNNINSKLSVTNIDSSRHITTNFINSLFADIFVERRDGETIIGNKNIIHIYQIFERSDDKRNEFTTCDRGNTCKRHRFYSNSTCKLGRGSKDNNGEGSSRGRNTNVKIIHDILRLHCLSQTLPFMYNIIII